MVVEKVTSIMADEGYQANPSSNLDALKMTNNDEVSKEGIGAKGTTLELLTNLPLLSTSLEGRLDIDQEIAASLAVEDQLDLLPLKEGQIKIEYIFTRDNLQHMCKMVDQEDQQSVRLDL